MIDHECDYCNRAMTEFGAVLQIKKDARRTEFDSQPRNEVRERTQYGKAA